MKSGLLSILFAFQFLLAFGQCNVIATASGSTVDCNGDCDGTIAYVYQNTGTPGAPYVVAVQNQTTGQWISTTTYTQEFQTIQLSGLCAGSYAINIQGQGCSTLTTATVSQPAPIVAYGNAVNAYNGQANGSVSINAQGGTPPYTYSINGTTYQSSSSFTSLAAGTYTFTVKDANGCTSTVYATINDVTQCNMIVTANPTMATCGGYCNASVWYAFYNTNNSGPYVIQLLNPNNQPVLTQTVNATQGSLSNVCPGNYTLVVTDANGCTGSYPVNVMASTPPVVSSVSTTNTTFGASTGSATVTVNGGTAPYSYTLNNGTPQSSNSFSNLAAGVYILTVVDANGCQTIYCFVIQETQACGVVVTSQAAPVSCYGTSTGSITFAYTNAYGPVVVSLQNSNGTTNQTQTASGNAGQGIFNNLPAGTYNVVITDAAGCTFTNTVTVTSAANPITLTATTVPATSGMSNGQITAIASGGTAPYAYAIGSPSNWQSTANFTGLAPGVYIVYVQDANGCQAIYCVQLTQVTGCQQAINATASPVSCAGGNNGTINYVFTSSGASAPFTITLNSANNTMQTQTSANASGSGTFNNVPSGVYYIQLTGANGCVSTTQVYVSQPNPLQVTNVAVTNASSGQPNGSAVVTVVGGTAPYTFSVNNGAPTTSNTLTGLSAGVQILTVTDANGCTTIYCFVVNQTTPCQTLAITATQVQSIQCYGSCTGALTWNYTSGGTAGLYTVTINHNGTNIATNTYTVGAFQGVQSNLCAGQYSITVTDPNGCTATYNLAITQPAPLSVTATTTNASSGSANGSIVVTATGGSGAYQYSLGGSTWQSSNVFNNLASGVYIVHVIDGNNCTQIYTVQVGQNTSCYITVTATQGANSSCAGNCNETINYAYAATNGTGPFTVTLTDQAGNVLSQTQNSANAQGTFTGLCGGVYIVNVTSANGCYGIYTVQVQTPGYANISVDVTDPTVGMNDGAFTMNVTGGTPNYEFSIDNQANWTSNPTFTNLGAGVYLVYSRDANTCTLVTSVKLGQSSASIEEVSSHIKAYPNPTTEFFIVEGEHVKVLSLKSSNGQEIALNQSDLTNGKLIDMGDLSTGVYFLTIEVNGAAEILKVIKK